VPLSVENERLMVTEPAQGLSSCDRQNGTKKLFDELSLGARRKIAVDIAIDAIGPTGLIPLNQESWEGWDYVARQEINAHLKSRQVNMVTCEADRSDDGAGGKVRAEVYEGE
jgi:hypothetical protein